MLKLYRIHIISHCEETEAQVWGKNYNGGTAYLSCHKERNVITNIQITEKEQNVFNKMKVVWCRKIAQLINYLGHKQEDLSSNSRFSRDGDRGTGSSGGHWLIILDTLESSELCAIKK